MTKKVPNNTENIEYKDYDMWAVVPLVEDDFAETVPANKEVRK